MMTRIKYRHVGKASKTIIVYIIIFNVIVVTLYNALISHAYSSNQVKYQISYLKWD